MAEVQSESYRGHTIRADGEQVDSCWGFVGEVDWALEQARSTVDYRVSQQKGAS